MKRLFLIAAIIPTLFSCTGLNVKRALNDVETYIMESPDSSLTVLESIERSRLKTQRNKAQHALLHAMALDKNYIDVTDDSLAHVAVDFYQKHGPLKNRARALYYLGIAYFNQKQYDKAILEYSKAEKIAEKCDSLFLGMIYTAMSYTYNNTYNSIGEQTFAQNAYDVFTDIDAEQYMRSSKYRMAVSFHNNDDYNNAVKVYNELIDESSSIDYIMIQSIAGMAHSMLEMDEVDYYTIDSLFRKARNEYEAEFEEKDYWAWAYSLYRIGKKDEADKLISEIQVSDEMTANFWKSRIAIYRQDYKAAYHYDKMTVHSQNNIINDILAESLATYQTEYYKSQLETSEYKIKTRTIGLIAIIIFTSFLSIIIFLLIVRYVKKQQEEKDRLFEYAEEIKRQLSDAEQNNNYSVLKRKYLSLYKSRFETIGTLTDQYYQSEGRTDFESLMFKKVTSLINEVKNDSKNRKAFEAMLDNDLDGIMTNIRNEMPKLKELDYSIFSYLIIGFDATTISRLLDMSVNNIYAHKRRLRIKIEERNPEHAAQFLEMLS